MAMPRANAMLSGTLVRAYADVTHSERQTRGSSASVRKFVNPIQRGGWSRFQSVKVKTADAIIGPAVKARNPMIHGEAKSQPSILSRRHIAPRVGALAIRGRDMTVMLVLR